MSEVYLALGSNLGDSVGNINLAIKLLNKHVHDISVASFYTSKAVGYTEQPDFINTAIRGQTELSPIELLKSIKSVEQEVGRISRFRWGPREIDIDIILYDMLILESDVLSIPHSEYTSRDFVLQPLIDLNPNLIDPRTQVPLTKILDRLSVNQKSNLHLFRVD
jgi:2-amino-4-hydroxy-6-hydroxymethyldihydropteridine diphosphokinase